MNESNEADMIFNQIDADRNAEFASQLSRIDVELYSFRKQQGVPDDQPVEQGDVSVSDSLKAAVSSKNSKEVTIFIQRVDSAEATATIESTLTYSEGELTVSRADQDNIEVVVATIDGINAARLMTNVLAEARGASF